MIYFALVKQLNQAATRFHQLVCEWVEAPGKAQSPGLNPDNVSYILYDVYYIQYIVYSIVYSKYKYSIV